MRKTLFLALLSLIAISCSSSQDDQFENYTFTQNNVLHLKMNEGQQIRALVPVDVEIMTKTMFIEGNVNTTLNFLHIFEGFQQMTVLDMRNTQIRCIPDEAFTTGKPYWIAKTNLESVVLPASLETIGKFSFFGCRNIESIELPAGLVSIDMGAFYCCYGLKSVTCRAATPPALLGEAVFGDIADDAILFVPAASVDLYAANADWSSYFAAGNIRPL